jgi:ankyrin repeat protein
MPTPLPDRPNLEQLKKQAKSLLAAARAGETSALTRFTALPAFSKTPLAELDARSIALHDAQSLIAREHGFPSWNTLRDEVEARTLSFDAALEEFVRSASGGAAARAERLLALHPRIASASFHAALLLGDATAVEKYLERDPQLATAVGGPMQWHPLLYVCHSCIAGGRPSGRDGVVAIARQLCALGADPNDQYHWNWHPELPRTVLWAALVTMRHFPLAEVLLEAGANPTDGVSVHIAGGKGDIAMLELLHRYGVDVNGIPGGVPPLVYMMGFATDPAGPRWLLEHGADPNRAWGDEDEAPLHVAARRWDVAMVEALITHGADPVRRRRDGRTPHTVAEMYGNHDIAGRLLELGAMDELSPLERFIAVCGRGDSAAARAMLAATPGLRRDLQPEHHLMLHRPAESGNTAVLQAMLESGFEADARDKDQVTPLHRAAMGGHVDAVRTLLAHGANVNALDGMFSASPLVWAVEGRNHPREGSDHVGVARVLITSGVSTEWRVPDGAPNPEQTLEGLRQLCRDAAGTGT